MLTVTSTLTNNEYRVEVSGRVDTTSASQLADTIAQAQLQEAKSLVFDFSETEYISSSGLRVVLAASKAYGKNFAVVNASSDVYDIFDMTGFADIMRIEKSLRKISLAGCELIGKGAIGSVYRIDDETIVKVYEKGVAKEVIDHERSCARTAFKCGLPCAITFDTVLADGKIGVVFELFKAVTLASVIHEDRENLKKYAEALADIAKKMHSTEALDTGVQSVKDLWLSWCDKAAGKVTEEELQEMRNTIHAVPDGSTFVHGDLHPKNVMVQNGEYLLIDMGDVGYGSPIFDLSVICTCLNISVKYMPPEQAYHAYGMTPETCQEFYKAFCESYAPDNQEIWKAAEDLAGVRQKLWRIINNRG